MLPWLKPVSNLMGFFDLFKSPTPTPPIHDALFGSLEFLKVREPAPSYWTGSGLFAPTGSTIEYLLEADGPGPTEAQRQFYRHLQATYADCVARVEPLLLDQFRNWQPDFEFQDFAQEFTLLAVNIPRLHTLPAAWSLTFSTVHDDDHEFTINFLGEQPTGVSIDG